MIRAIRGCIDCRRIDVNPDESRRCKDCALKAPVPEVVRVAREMAERSQKAAGETIAIRDALKAKIDANRRWERAHPWRHMWNVILDRTPPYLLTEDEMTMVIATARPYTG